MFVKLFMLGLVVLLVSSIILFVLFSIIFSKIGFAVVGVFKQLSKNIFGEEEE